MGGKNSGRRREYPWETVDWTKENPKTVVARLGCSYAVAVARRKEQLGSFSPLAVKSFNPIKKVKTDPATWDWNLQDIILSDLHGVSKERVRQIRQRLRKPKSPQHRQGRKGGGM
jgi:hypothetical protein